MATKMVMFTMAVMLLVKCSVTSSTPSTEPVQNPETKSNFAVELLIRNELNKLRSHVYINPSIDIASIQKDINAGATRLKVSVSNAEVIGIKDFEIGRCNFEGVTEGRLDLTLMFPEVIISGTNYKINGIIAGVMPMHSDGPFEIKVDRLNLTAWGNVFINPTQATTRLPVPVFLEEVEADVSMGSLNVNMVNILGDLSDEFNLMLSEIGIDLINEFKPQLDVSIAKYLERVLNNLLNKKKVGIPDDVGAIMQQTMEEVVSGVMLTIVHALEDQRNAKLWA